MVKKLKKQYETPNEGWNEERIEEEEKLMEDYGLKNKEEIYRAESILRSLRREARKLVSQENEQERKEIIKKANRLGLVKEDADLDEILTLTLTNILDRRLQTAVNRRGHSNTIKEARQLVNHGHVYIKGRRINVPSYLLTQGEEKNLDIKIPENNQEKQEKTDQEESEE